jgi:hypothetical protein
MNQDASPQDFNRVLAAQSAALGILGRPIVLANLFYMWHVLYFSRQ